ncbi:MAG: hypothetical protein H0W97_01585 [Actinobacteria bacterium]|nr:hypothetical protein [Actinomycetota bacterium]
MPLFSRFEPAGFAFYAMDLYEDALELVDEQTRRAGEQATRERFKDARVTWLGENRAERSFPCGVVPDPEPEPGKPRMPVPRLNVPRRGMTWVQVIAAVLPSDLAFIRGQETGEIVEVGRIPRSAIRKVDVVDASDVPIPEPIRETFEPPQLALLVLTWTNASVDDEDRFAFRSPWMAWQAARWLMAARQ